jgi:hypothetical protein
MGDEIEKPVETPVVKKPKPAVDELVVIGRIKRMLEPLPEGQLARVVDYVLKWTNEKLSSAPNVSVTVNNVQ